MAIDLEEALDRMVNGQRLGELRAPSLRILKLWARNRITAAPDDAQLHHLEAQIDAVIEHRRRHPLPRPVTVPHFDSDV
jgi:hypothetical protein